MIINIFLISCFLTHFLLSRRLWRVPIPTLPLNSRVVLETPKVFASYDGIKNFWFTSQMLKHFCRKCTSTRFLTLVQIFCNHLCTHARAISVAQIWCNICMDRTIVIIKFMGVVRRRSWRMEALIRPTFVFVSSSMSRFISDSSPFPKS
jgi:hypothetical protein